MSFRKLHIVKLACVLAMLPALASAQATTVTTNQSFPFSGIGEGPCVGTIEFSAIEHIVTRVTTDASGGTHMSMHVNVERFDGTVVATGAKIQGSDAYNDTFNGSGPGPWEHTFVQTWMGQTQGSSDNLWMTEVVHVTINADGTTSVSFDKLRIECRG